MMNFVNNSVNISQISNDPLILLGSILMGLGIVLPCLIWFVRNAIRVFGKKDYWFFNKALKYVWIAGILVFIIGLIILIVKLTTGA